MWPRSRAKLEAFVDRIDLTDLVLRGATRDERIRECRRMVVGAPASDANAERKEAYLDLAKKWRELAADRERAGKASH
jgi:hypothetical protein